MRTAAKTLNSSLAGKVHIEDRDTNVDGMYLRIIVHTNEHMGQLVALRSHDGCRAAVVQVGSNYL